MYIKKELKPWKVFSDEQGRYIAIEVNYQNKKILIVNLYAPNGAKTSFLQELQKHVNAAIYEHLAIVGDFNGTSILPNKKRGKKGTGKLPNTFFNLVEHENLTDIWRKRNRRTKK